MTYKISDLKSNTKKHSYRINDQQVKRNNLVIEDSELLLHIEPVPTGLSFIDLIRFRNLITKSIGGTVLRVFNLKNYLIYIYTRLPNSANRLLLLTAKIDILTKITGEPSNADLWIIQDENYLCLGVFRGAPVFIKSFENVYEIIDHLDIMTKTISEYSPIENIRFFGCNPTDFGNLDYNVCEYSQSFMSESLDGYESLTQYCKDKNIQSKSENFANFGLVVIGIGLLCLAGISNVARSIMYSKSNSLNNAILLLSNYKQIPSPQHYKNMYEVENNKGSWSI